MENDTNGREVQARLAVFGFAPTAASMRVLNRSVSWRATRSLLSAGIGIGAAPALFFLPLHFPWPTASILIGLFTARSKWKEKQTLLSVEGTCPACGAAVKSEKPARLKEPHVLHCTSCGRAVTLGI